MKTPWVALLIIVWLMLTGLSACTPSREASLGEPAADEKNTTPALLSVTNTPPVESKPTVASSSTEANNDAVDKEDTETAVLTYERRGGLKGIDSNINEWRFYEDGRIVGSDGAAWQVEPKVIASLVTEITASGFQNLENSYIPEDTCCDRVTHVLTVQTTGQKHTVETLDAAEMPQSLQDNLQKINTFLMTLYE